MWKNLIKKLPTVGVVLAVLVSALGYAPASFAATATTNNATQSGNNGLQISPTRTDLSINPRESTSFQISIKNVSSIALTAKATLNDFKSDNETGTPQLIIDTKQQSPRSIRPYLSGVSDVPLKPGETKNLQFLIDVPKNAAPGGYYGAIRYSAIPVNPQENVGPSQVSLTASVASLVLMEINGPVNETLQLDSLNAQKHNAPGTFFFGSGPDKVSIKLTNKGNGFAEPIGRVYIEKGGKQIYSYEFNSNSIGLHSTILPNSSRRFTDSIKNVNKFGQYKIVASIAYKQGDEAVTLTQKFWVIPNAYLYGFIAIIVLIAAGVGLWKLARRGRR